MYKTKLTKQGTISLPVVLRRKYNLQQGDELAIEDSGKIVISKVPDLASLREKNRKFSQKKGTYTSGGGFAVYVKENYGSKN